ncbi:hypothetical protein [Clostridium tertium]|uniref:hypothetical protein n=1 Tax=Clostridium tertium TaxID=1559 RepID=UPI0023B2751F|nr:hypothetical protein [Clostridium tertium]
MREVVIKGERSNGYLLPWRWNLELLRRKGIKAYPYVWDICNDEYHLMGSEKADKLKSFYVTYYLTENLGETIKDITAVDDSLIINVDIIDREDSDLIKVVKLVDDKSIIKCIEIPDEVEYTIEVSEKGNEYIEEKHRKWY